MIFRRAISLLVCGGAVALAVAAAQREELVAIPDGRRVSVAVPAGFTVKQERDAAGLTHVQLAQADRRVNLDLLFVPDPDGQAGTARLRRERMVELFNDYVADSVEKGMQFEELGPRRGAGTYCVFTDAKLVGKTELPAGEYIHLTCGVKSWPGVMVVVRLFSDDTTGPAYQTAMRLLRESVEERPVPLR